MRASGGMALALVGTLVALAPFTGCRTPGLQLQAGSYHGPGFEIPPPPGLGERWEPVAVEGALLTFRGRATGAARDASLSLLERCGEPQADPRTLARHLLIGLEDRSFTLDRAVPVAGAPGWEQRLRARAEVRVVELATVTRVAGACTTDFVLVAPAVAPFLEDFEAFWQGYRPVAGGDAP